MRKFNSLKIDIFFLLVLRFYFIYNSNKKRAKYWKIEKNFELIPCIIKNLYSLYYRAFSGENYFHLIICIIIYLMIFFLLLWNLVNPDLSGYQNKDYGLNFPFRHILKHCIYMHVSGNQNKDYGLNFSYEHILKHCIYMHLGYI